MQRKDISTLVVLAAYKKRWENDIHEPVDEILMGSLNAPEKVVYAAMERDSDNGYIEYGVSLRTGWLTEKGEQYLIDNHVV